jgi:hypothetical protein
MKITKKTIQEMIREELKSLNERPRQLKDKKKEMLVVKNGKVQVIDKKDWKKYEKKGYLVAEKKSVDESYSGKLTDFKYDFETALNNLGISSKAIKKISKKGKGYEVRLSSYMNKQKTWEKLGDAIGAKLVNLDTGRVNIGLYESVTNKKKIQTENENPCWDGYKQVGMKTKNGRQVPNCVKESVNEAKIVGSYPRRKEPNYSGIPTSKSSTEELVHTYIDTALISGYPFDDEDDNPNFDSGRQQADMKLSSYSQMLKKRGFDRRKLDKLVDTVRKKQTYPKIEENLNEKRVKQAVSGGKVHKFITGKNLTYKGKKYDDIEFELLGIDNREQLVKLKVLAPKNLFGQEMNVPFKTIRRGPFIKTDTSK